MANQGFSDDYAAKIAEFSGWLKREFIVDGCGDPKVDGCLSCEAVLANQSLAAMMRIIEPHVISTHTSSPPKAG